MKANTGERNVRIVNPHGVTWSSRYYDLPAAWSRVLKMYSKPDTGRNRKEMERIGWKVGRQS